MSLDWTERMWEKESIGVMEIGGAKVVRWSVWEEGMLREMERTRWRRVSVGGVVSRAGSGRDIVVAEAASMVVSSVLDLPKVGKASKGGASWWGMLGSGAVEPLLAYCPMADWSCFS